MTFDKVAGQNIPKSTNYSMYGHTFLAITQPFSGQSGWKILREYKGLLTIDYSGEIKVFGPCYFRFFGPYVGPKMGAAPRPPIWVRGLKTQPKSWPTGWTFWVHHYLESLFQIFWWINPLPLLKLVISPLCTWWFFKELLVDANLIL